MQDKIEVGYDALVSDGDTYFGVVWEVFPESLVVYVEKAGDFVVPRSAIDAVHNYKVFLLRRSRLVCARRPAIFTMPKRLTAERL